MHPLKVKVNKSSRLTLYFESQELRAECLGKILAMQGHTSQIDSYVVNNKKSQQGAFTVVQAKHGNSGSKVAVKVIYKDPNVISDKSSSGSIYMHAVPEIAMREKLSDLKLSSHYITKMVEYIEDDQYVYLISQWMNRRDLGTYMKKH